MCSARGSARGSLTGLEGLAYSRAPAGTRTRARPGNGARIQQGGDAATVTIGIGLDRKVDSVDGRIFGNFIQDLGRRIHGGVSDKGSPHSDECGRKSDVLESVPP